IADRRMKIGLTHFLCLFVVVIAEVTVPKVTPALCDGDMECFYPTDCKGQPSSTFTSVSFDHSVISTCKAIMKIRPYSESKWLIELESLDSNVKLIQLSQAVNLFSCADTGSTVNAKYKGSDKVLMSQSP
ncbi:hypothetical protein PFISCL1PPCAC_9039, partial [Pristionchus fissidentatus]